ncbi:MAG TPA: MOSC N-terminal beta barrel domain-containing protein [Gemmatimonadales bacterium]|nr:MOSC N-terminal beta barrel domain-containing protein [Gemmatimonadales bacterium]
MRVSEIWRYPVKSMAGERLGQTSVDALGIVGDRVVHVRDTAGRVITARTHPRLLGHQATLSASGEPLVDGRVWTEPSVLADVAAIVGRARSSCATPASTGLTYSRCWLRPTARSGPSDTITGAYDPIS